jgi:hypothetical protein
VLAIIVANAARTVILPGTALDSVDIIPDGTVMGIGMVVAEVGMVAKFIPDGTVMVAGTVVTEFTEVAKIILDGTTGVVIIAKVAVSEVTNVAPDRKSMVISVTPSLIVLAPVSAITLGTRISEVAIQALVAAVSLSA